ncbi:peptidoglycan-binding domain-containing protein [Streptomyces sp. NPDC007157]|uniref:peptidoglycan-binding domain-containing protein n=1 Tax=Streptomyces sp. NPDC007157 TaxID=3154681 RepID=UPI0033D15CD1
MTDTTGGHRCPECGAPRGADNTPSCDCTRRASDALRDARTAEQAAAEDFDPLRIRPYVDLSGAGAGTEAGTEAGADARDGARGGGDAGADGGRTQPPTVVGSATTALRVVREPAGAGAELGEASVASPGRGEAPRRRPRWVLVLSIAGAVFGILAAAGFASGLFSHVTPARDTAAPKDVRASVPDVTPSTGSPSAAAPVTSARAPAPAVPAASADASASPTASPARTVSASPSATASRSATPTRSASTTGTAASAQPTSAPVLRLGDSGAEVTELQLRLAQLRLLSGRADGHYDRETEDAVRTYQLARGILTDESGVYGTATRTALESETTEP